MDTQTILVMAAMGLCPSFLILGLVLGALFMFAVMNRRARRWRFITLSGVHAKEISSVLKPYVEDGWEPFLVTHNESVTSFVDIQLRAFI